MATPTARDFSGASQYFSLLDNDDFSFTDGAGTDSAFSIGAWAYMDDATRYRFVLKTDDNGEWILTTGADDKLYCDCYKDGFSAYVGRIYGTAITGDQGAWHHYVATYSGGETTASVKIYRDGVQVDNANRTTGTYTGMSNTDDPVYIGRSGTTYSNGRQQATFVANAELSQAEIDELYNAGAGAFYNALSAGLKAKMLAFYNMSEASGSALDATGNGHNMTDNNSVGTAEGHIQEAAGGASPVGGMVMMGVGT